MFVFYNIYMYILIKTNMKKSILSTDDISRVIELYQTNINSTHKIANLFKTSHKNISKILKDNGIVLNKRGGKIKDGQSKNVEKIKTPKYYSNDTDKKLIARCKLTKKEFKDINNLSGSLTEHILKTYGDVKIPTNNYQRKKYEINNGKKWFEEYFDIVEIGKETERKCKLCDWSTSDLSNKTGCFENHIKKDHQISIDDYLTKFPEDIIYHKNYIKDQEKEQFLQKEENYVICRLCNKKMKMITNAHLKNKHQITNTEYKLLFPNDKFVSKSTSRILKQNAEIINMNQSPTWESSGEIEIKNFIQGLGFDVEKSKNRKLLNGKEIDIIIPELKIAIEYNGLYFHTEKMGKTSNYHLNKTIECYNIGYKLYQIFEDEWILKKDIVKNKIKHILKCNDGIKVGGRKIKIKKITSEEKSVFLNNNHIQGNDASTIYYGGFYNNVLIGVITFNEQRNMTKSVKNEYELSRYAVDQNYVVMGLASKFIKHFIDEYNPDKIISFADRRWTPNDDHNLYTQIGFKLNGIVQPRYFYYNSKFNRYKRFHKFGFGKNTLKKKYPNLDFSKSEKELTEELGFDRIWDCGLFKYELKLNEIL